MFAFTWQTCGIYQIDNCWASIGIGLDEVHLLSTGQPMLALLKSISTVGLHWPPKQIYTGPINFSAVEALLLG